MVGRRRRRGARIEEVGGEDVLEAWFQSRLVEFVRLSTSVHKLGTSFFTPASQSLHLTQKQAAVSDIAIQSHMFRS